MKKQINIYIMFLLEGIRSATNWGVILGRTARWPLDQLIYGFYSMLSGSNSEIDQQHESVSKCWIPWKTMGYFGHGRLPINLQRNTSRGRLWTLGRLNSASPAREVVPSYPRQNVGDPNGGIFKAQLILGAGNLKSWAARDDMENLRDFSKLAMDSRTVVHK